MRAVFPREDRQFFLSRTGLRNLRPGLDPGPPYSPASRPAREAPAQGRGGCASHRTGDGLPRQARARCPPSFLRQSGIFPAPRAVSDKPVPGLTRDLPTRRRSGPRRRPRLKAGAGLPYTRQEATRAPSFLPQRSLPVPRAVNDDPRPGPDPGPPSSPASRPAREAPAQGRGGSSFHAPGGDARAVTECDSTTQSLPTRRKLLESISKPHVPPCDAPPAAP